MSEHVEAQQAAAEGLGTLGISTTLMVHYPSKIKAPEGVLLTTDDQLQSQLAKHETTAYAFPSFGAAQSVMRSLATTQQTAILIYECHADTGPAEIAAKVFDTCNRHLPAVREIKQLTETIKYQRYPTILFMVKMNYLHTSSTIIEWQVPDVLCDELILPARIAYEDPVGRELRQGQFPGSSETNTSPSGCYNSDRSKGSVSVPLTIKFEKNSNLQRIKVREAIETLQKETSILQDTQFQIKEGVDWYRLHKLRETLNFTVMSTRHLSDQERTALALELMSFRIKYFFLSKAQIVLQLEGIDIEVLRNLLHCSTTYLPFGQRQQSTQVALSQVKITGGKWYQIEVKLFANWKHAIPAAPDCYKSSINALIEDGDSIIETELGFSLIRAFSATRFEFQTVVDDDNSNIAMLTFWIPQDTNHSFPCTFSVISKHGTKVSFTIEHCGNILPQTSAPGEPPRRETKGEHWRRIGERCNPSYRNRLTVIAPVSIQSASQKRRFGLLKESSFDAQNQLVSYTYAEETYPWILFLDSLPERDSLDAFLTHFGQFESVNSEEGDFCKQSSLRLDNISKQTRIITFGILSGKQCQINRVEGLESALYLTKVDALQIYPFKACYLMLLVPPNIDYRALLTSNTKLVVSAAWKFGPHDQVHTRKNSSCVPPPRPSQHERPTDDKLTEHRNIQNGLPLTPPTVN